MTEVEGVGEVGCERRGDVSEVEVWEKLQKREKLRVWRVLDKFKE